jgi:hypothetical protein
MTNERHDNLTLDESLTDPSGKTLGTNSPLATESQLGTADGSVHSALSNGKAIGVDDDPTNGTRVNDFTTFGTDDAALQDIVTWIENNGVGGRLYFPARTSAGNDVVIENTVATSDDVEIPIDIVQMGGGRGQATGTNTAAVTTTIDNGDPMFRLTGDIPGTSAVKRSEFIGEKWNLEGNDATLIEVEEFDNGTIRPGYVLDPGGHIVHLKGFADGNFVDILGFQRRRITGRRQRHRPAGQDGRRRVRQHQKRRDGENADYVSLT